MLNQFQDTWLPRILFYATLALAVFLILLVLAAPLLVAWRVGHSPLIDVFAEDVAVRRTALGAAVGLAVTAYLCFRPKPESQQPPAEA